MNVYSFLVTYGFANNEAIQEHLINNLIRRGKMYLYEMYFPTITEFLIDVHSGVRFKVN